MQSVVRRLAGGGDTAVEKMIETSASLGIDLIELVWIKDAGSRPSVAQVYGGYKYPKVSTPTGFHSGLVEADWVEDVLKFYPDEVGRCWGYIFDTPDNRGLLYNSLGCGWFRIVDKKIREEIQKEAATRGLPIEPVPQNEINVRKTIREKEAEKRVKDLEFKLQEMEELAQRMKKELEENKNIKQVQVEKRLQGNPVPRAEIPEVTTSIKRG